jgi:GT2 family glycosyltransferase
MPSLSVIIVSWNVRELLRRCLASVRADGAALDVEMIVVESASADGSAAMVAAEFPEARLLAQAENVGYARGNNIGLAAAQGEFLLLLNPDTEIQPGALGHLVECLRYSPRVGVVGPQLLNPDGTVQSSRRRFPTLLTSVFESTWLDRLAPRAVLRRYYMLDHGDDERVEVDWVVGACLMTRRDVVAAVGPLDEAYFMYSEELDWCRRVKLAGWQVLYLPSARVIHHLGKSSEQAVTARHIRFQQAKLRYFRKFHGRVVTVLLRLFLLTTYLWQLGLEVTKGALGSRRPLRWQRVRSYWQVLRSGLRPAGY